VVLVYPFAVTARTMGSASRKAEKLI